MRLKQVRSGRRWAIAVVGAVAIAFITGVGAYSTSIQTPAEDKAAAQRYQKIQQHYADLQAQGLANPIPPTPDVDLTDPPAPPIEAKGISTDVEYPGDNYVFTTVWSGPSGGHNLVAYAGAMADNETQGVLLVLDEDRAAQTTTVTPYVTPTATGAVTLTSADGLVLSMTSADGTVYTFDLNTDQWR